MEDRVSGLADVAQSALELPADIIGSRSDDSLSTANIGAQMVIDWAGRVSLATGLESKEILASMARELILGSSRGCMVSSQLSEEQRCCVRDVVIGRIGSADPSLLDVPDLERLTILQLCAVEHSLYLESDPYNVVHAELHSAGYYQQDGEKVFVNDDYKTRSLIPELFGSIAAFVVATRLLVKDSIQVELPPGLLRTE